MRTTKSPVKVFIQEDDLVMQKKIAEELEPYNYRISFFSKDEPTFDLLSLNPDILIQDYAQNKVINFYEWN
ncbi:MAG: hypothetical protein K2X86_07725 [Cytophagaceae bacterium]|nr:hypothetical protein [Cytophagaceae bacterium]